MASVVDMEINCYKGLQIPFCRAAVNECWRDFLGFANHINTVDAFLDRCWNNSTPRKNQATRQRLGAYTRTVKWEQTHAHKDCDENRCHSTERLSFHM
jgi:hypothetical protein